MGFGGFQGKQIEGVVAGDLVQGRSGQVIKGLELFDCFGDAYCVEVFGEGPRNEAGLRDIREKRK